jgi:hypothetical protein
MLSPQRSNPILESSLNLFKYDVFSSFTFLVISSGKFVNRRFRNYSIISLLRASMPVDNDIFGFSGLSIAFFYTYGPFPFFFLLNYLVFSSAYFTLSIL